MLAKLSRVLLIYCTETQGLSKMYTTEYESPIMSGLSDNDDVPCAVCHVSTIGTVMMIPAKLTCSTDWTVEYTGYLMSQHASESAATHKCADAMAEKIPGTSANTNGGCLEHIETLCGDKWPNYDPEKELTCVVCTH